MKKFAIVAAFAAVSMATAAVAGSQPNRPTMSTQPVATTVARSLNVNLPCTAGSGDVSRPLYVTNNTGAAIAAGKVIHWQLGASKGQQSLSATLAAGANASLLGPPGSGGTCSAWFAK